ncbi:MAG: nucleotidyltransferase [Clostridia bacterium]|nr:nucleotidyltransferase [Clostridia bacterium]MBR3954431.1 nucleotidyltransferase [Clostridia bacterium]
MKNTTLVIMAAGMGSRYGGLKQMDPIGANGEVILDYSVYDAIEAGFDKVIFVIKHEIEEDFKALMQGKYENRIKVEYAFQNIDNIPDGYTVPEGRVKPWGTGHAVLSCDGMIDGPFAVINADDYYGKETFKLVCNALKNAENDNEFCMVGFKVENTLTENGHVARGVCQTDENGYLTDIVERTKIARKDGKIMFTEDDGASWTELAEGSTVSMNCWGFSGMMMTELKNRFKAFFEKNADNLLKCEYFLPFVVDELLKEGKVTVKVMDTTEKWYGVTYKEDKAVVMAALRQKVIDGIYPDKLW